MSCCHILALLMQSLKAISGMPGRNALDLMNSIHFSTHGSRLLVVYHSFHSANVVRMRPEALLLIRDREATKVGKHTNLTKQSRRKESCCPQDTLGASEYRLIPQRCTLKKVTCSSHSSDDVNNGGCSKH